MLIYALCVAATRYAMHTPHSRRVGGLVIGEDFMPCALFSTLISLYFHHLPSCVPLPNHCPANFSVLRSFSTSDKNCLDEAETDCVQGEVARV